MTVDKARGGEGPANQEENMMKTDPYQLRCKCWDKKSKGQMAKQTEGANHAWTGFVGEGF